MTHFRFRGYSSRRISNYAADFRTARPFPHVEIKDFILLSPKEVLSAFPDPEWPHWTKYADTYQNKKMICSDIETIPPLIASMIHELTSPAFLAFLEKITGIKDLIPDPYLEGGGLHCSGVGGILAPHTDFHIYTRLSLYRRINLLVYLNPGWQKSFGGCLELWQKNKSVPEKVIVPEWGSCVIFRTDDQSVHGFSDPIQGDGRWRRSIALYYYTTQDVENYSGDTVTYWQNHKVTGRMRSKAQLKLYKSLLFMSRVFARLAHQINPNTLRAH